MANDVRVSSSDSGIISSLATVALELPDKIIVNMVAYILLHINNLTINTIIMLISNHLLHTVFIVCIYHKLLIYSKLIIPFLYLNVIEPEYNDCLPSKCGVSILLVLKENCLSLPAYFNKNYIAQKF